MSVALGIINSHERHLNLVDSYYEDFFDREPDSAGLAFWTSQLDENVRSDQGVAEALLATPEFFNRAR